MPSTPSASERRRRPGRACAGRRRPTTRIVLPAAVPATRSPAAKSGRREPTTWPTRAAGHHLADRHRRRVGRRVAHPPAHVRVEREPEGCAAAPGRRRAPGPASSPGGSRRGTGSPCGRRARHDAAGGLGHGCPPVGVGGEGGTAARRGKGGWGRSAASAPGPTRWPRSTCTCMVCRNGRLKGSAPRAGSPGPLGNRRPRASRTAAPRSRRRRSWWRIAASWIRFARGHRVRPGPRAGGSSAPPRPRPRRSGRRPPATWPARGRTWTGSRRRSGCSTSTAAACSGPTPRPSRSGTPPASTSCGRATSAPTCRRRSPASSGSSSRTAGGPSPLQRGLHPLPPRRAADDAGHGQRHPAARRWMGLVGEAVDYPGGARTCSGARGPRPDLGDDRPLRRRRRAFYRNPAARRAANLGDCRLPSRFVDPRDYEALVGSLAAAREARLVAEVRTSAGARWHRSPR